MLYTPKKIPVNWYKYDVIFSLELLKEYIRGVEQQVIITIETFHRETEIHPSDDLPMEGVASPIEIYRGLDSQTWDLTNIFEDFFPNLQRRGALITLYSYLENELDNLCELFIQTEKLTISLNDMRGTGIERSILFLTKIIELEINKNTDIWREIRNIQKIRNLIVHNDAKLTDRSGNPIENIHRYVTGSAYLAGDNEIKILDGYLLHVIETFDLQFREINNLIAAKHGT